MNSIPFSTPRTPKGYKRLPEPTSPLARFDQKLPSQLPSLRIWKETCKSFHDSDASVSPVSSHLSSAKKKTDTLPLKHPYEPFDHLMLLEDGYKDEDFCNSFNVHASTKSSAKRRRDLMSDVRRLNWNRSK